MLAAADALAWPMLWVVVFSHAPKPVGLIGPVVTAVALLCVSNGMDAPTRSGINVPKWKRYFNHLNREGRPS